MFICKCCRLWQASRSATSIAGEAGLLSWFPSWRSSTTSKMRSTTRLLKMLKMLKIPSRRTNWWAPGSRGLESCPDSTPPHSWLGLSHCRLPEVNDNIETFWDEQMNMNKNVSLSFLAFNTIFSPILQFKPKHKLQVVRISRKWQKACSPFAIVLATMSWWQWRWKTIYRIYH